MSSKLPLICNPNDSKLMLGAGYKDSNIIVIKLENTTNETLRFSGRGASGTLSVTISVGTRAQDLVATAEDSSGILAQSKGGWGSEPTVFSDGQTTWKFRLPNEVLPTRGTSSLTLQNFDCNTDPGKAKLILRANITGYDDYEASLEIEKNKPDTLKILYFKATPPQIITQKDRDDFKLEWNTILAQEVELRRATEVIKTFAEGRDGFQSGKKVSFEVDAPSLTSVYTLKATDGSIRKESDEREVSVPVLERGWHRSAEFGRPSVLCNMDNVKLYGIFIKKGKPVLCSSTLPLIVWHIEKDSPDHEVAIPENMETSPAVCFRNKLWLVGGSAADTRDPDKFSDHISSYNITQRKWIPERAADWSRRMGHACVVWKNKIWVLGGFDYLGNACNDVWSWEYGAEKWEQEQASAPWEKRCMHAATVFQDKIWICGGVKQPFGDPLGDTWWSADGKNWNLDTKKTRSASSNPIGCALQVIGRKLHLFGTFRDGNESASRYLVWNEGQETWDESEIEKARSWDTQEGQTFSLSSAEYGGLAFVRSLGYLGSDNAGDLVYYVP